MLFLIRHRIRLYSGFDQRKRHIGILHGMSVLTVIQKRYAVMSFRKIDPFLSAAFETCLIPACILMCLPRQTAKLHVKRRLIRMHRHRKMYFQQSLVLFPVHMCHKFNSSAVGIKQDLLLYRRIWFFSGDLKGCPHRSEFCPFQPLHVLQIPGFFRIIHINIPVIIINRFILIHAQQISTFPVLYHLSVIFLVIEARKHPLFIQLNLIKRCLKFEVTRQNKRHRCIGIFNSLCRGKRLISFGGQPGYKRYVSILCLLNRIERPGMIRKRLRLEEAKVHNIVPCLSRRIKDRHRIACACNRLLTLRRHRRSLPRKLFIFFLRHLIYFMNSRPGKNIMELIQQYRLPHIFQFLLRIWNLVHRHDR